VLRFLIASREEVDSVQLRDDLLSMLVGCICCVCARCRTTCCPGCPACMLLTLVRHTCTATYSESLLLTCVLLLWLPPQVAGHETTGSVLTWTVDLLARHPEKLRKVSER